MAPALCSLIFESSDNIVVCLEDDSLLSPQRFPESDVSVVSPSLSSAAALGVRRLRRDACGRRLAAALPLFFSSSYIVGAGPFLFEAAQIVAADTRRLSSSFKGAPLETPTPTSAIPGQPTPERFCQRAT